MSEHSAAPARILVDIVADPVCPWCFIGLKSFEAARAQIDGQARILPRIRAYQLNPGTPMEGVDRASHYEKKFPDAEQRATISYELKAAAAGAGVAFDPSLPTLIPNTLKAHQLIRLAHFDGAHERVAHRLYDAYWGENANIGDDDVLFEIGTAAGLNGDQIRADLASETSRAEIAAEAEGFRQAGVNGVPTFIVNERIGFAGALPPGKLAEAFLDAARQTQEMTT